MVPNDLDIVRLFEEASKMLEHFHNALLVCIDPDFPIRSKERTPQL